MTLFKHEMKMNQKSLLLWSICVGGICVACILLYTSLQESLGDMAEVYSNMGAFSTALGMDQLSLATMSGFYATEVGIIHSLGGAMFAAMTGAVIVSKEEAEHTSEFLHVFPLNRTAILLQKYLALAANVLLLNVICVAMYLVGFAVLGESMPMESFFWYHLAQFIMQLEVGSVCFLLSACSKKNKIGAGLGIAVILYAMDLMCRIIPAIKNLKYITPFYYANASDIFVKEGIDVPLLSIGGVITVIAVVIAFVWYQKRDLAA